MSDLPLFELEGLRFGGDEPIQVADFTPGGPEARTQDAQNGVGDGVYVGRDYFGGSTWAWDLFTNVEDEAEADGLVDRLMGVWYDEELRTTPNRVVPLRYRINGRWRRVYGRPRRFDPPAPGSALAQQGRHEVSADFLLVHHLVYDDAEEQQSVRGVTETYGAWEFPLLFPTEPAAPPEGYNWGGFRVGGRAKTPAIIDVRGPGTDLWVEVDGSWRVRLVGELTSFDTVTIDTRPWVRTVFRNGAPAAGLIDPRTSMADLMLAPGDHRLRMGGALSNNATATIRWSSAYYFR